MPTPHQSDPRSGSTGKSALSARRKADGPESADAAGSSLISLSPASNSSQSQPSAANTDDSPTIITQNRPGTHSVQLKPGHQLSHFEIIQTVGSGGMASVLKARDLELGRVVALKILPTDMAQDPDNIARFKQEARSAARLDHENVARVFFCGEDQGLHFIAFEFVEGDNLRALIDQRGTIPPIECVRYMIQSSGGLAHAAERGVVHRDVKPSNIVITPDGRVKIVDMGLARTLSGHSINGGVTQSGITLGTFDYISPEQALDPRRADVRSDIYSLGCAFYHALTGQPPVPEGTAAKKLYAHQNEPVVDPRVLNAKVPDELAAVLAKMMAKDPNKRYQTPAELITDLGLLANRLNLRLDGVDQEQIAQSASRAFADPPKVPMGLVAALSGVAVVILVLFSVLTDNGSQSQVDQIVPSWDEFSASRPNPPLAGDNVKGPITIAPPPRMADGKVNVDTGAELARALRQPGVVEIRLKPDTVYDLTEETKGVVVEGKPVSVIGVAGPDAPTVRLIASAADSQRFAGNRAGSLSIRRSESVLFEGVRFQIVDTLESDETIDDPVGVAVTDTATAKFVGCWFESVSSLKASTVSGLFVERNPLETPTELSISHGFFAVRRAIGIRLSGRINADVEETVFAPHMAAIELDIHPLGMESEHLGGTVRVTSSTFLLDQKGSAFRCIDGAHWQISSGYSVYSAPPLPDDADGMTIMMNDPTERRPAVLRVFTDRFDFDVKLIGRVGEPNAFYLVDPLAIGSRGYTFEQVQQQWSPAPVVDPGAIELARDPWESNEPVAELADKTNREPWRAMRLETTLRPVQISRSPLKLIGSRYRPELGNLRIYDHWPPPLTTEVPTAKGEKIWYPKPPAEEQARLGRNTFESLSEAVNSLRPGDVLLIRHDGRLPVPSAAFDSPKIRATLRPFPGSKPILVADTPMKSQETSALFQIGDGELTFEELEIELTSTDDEFDRWDSHSAVAILGGGRCTFRDCTITLNEQRRIPVSAVTIRSDTKGRFSLPTKPTVSFENTMIRGRGQALDVHQARPFELKVKNSIATLSGPFVSIQPSKRMSATSSTATISVNQLTCMVDSPWLDYQVARPSVDGMDMFASALRVEVTAERSLFASLNQSMPLARLTNMPKLDPEEYLSWRGSRRPNWYARRADESPFLVLEGSDSLTESKELDWEKWFEWTEERASRSLGRVTFLSAPSFSRELLEVTPTDLEIIEVDIPNASPGDAGAETRQVGREE